MSLQDLELSPFLISELYKDALVSVQSGEVIQEAPIEVKTKPVTGSDGYVPADTSSLGLPPATSKPKATPIFQEEPVKPIPQKQPTGKLKYLGGNAKNIAFLVNCPTDVFLPDKHLDWLGKMLTACQLNLGDVAIINIANARRIKR